MVKAILFDLDGTLLDTLPDLNACMNAMLAHFGFPPVSMQDTRLFVGHGGREFTAMSLPENERHRLDECYAYYGCAERFCGNTRSTPFWAIPPAIPSNPIPRARRRS